MLLILHLSGNLSDVLDTLSEGCAGSLPLPFIASNELRTTNDDQSKYTSNDFTTVVSTLPHLLERRLGPLQP